MRKLTEDGLCSIEGCGRKHQAKTYCLTHYRRWQRGDDLSEPITVIDPTRGCAFEGCERPYKSNGYCGTHYERLRTGRDLVSVDERKKYSSDREKYLDNIQILDSGCWEWTGGRSTSYGVIRAGGRSIMTHRYAYEEFIGPIPEGMEVDHQCRNRLCSNPEHLKAVTRKENRENLGLDSRNTSGYRGVSRAKGGNWRVSVTHNRKIYSKGGFKTAEEANEYAVQLRLSLYTNNVEDRLHSEN